MSDDTTSPYGEITRDVEMSAYQVWDKVAGLAQAQKREAPEKRHGAEGLLWEGSLVGAMEEIWPEISGEVRQTREVNAVRRNVHQYLTRRGLLHCDKRGGGTGGRLSLWWVRSDWDPQPQGYPGLWAPADAEDEVYEAPELESELDLELEEYEAELDASESVLLRQMLTVILAAQEVGSPLTTTALRQLPTTVGPFRRRELLDQLEACGAIEARELRVPSGHTVTVWVGAQEVPEFLLSVEGMPQGYSLPQEWAGQEIAAADVLARFLDDFRDLEAAYREVLDTSQQSAAQKEELASLREQISVINKALGR